MRDLQVLEPADVVTRRIALEEEGAEECCLLEREDESMAALWGAVDLLVPHYMEMLAVAEARGLEAPTFTMSGRERPLHLRVVELRHARHRFWRHHPVRALAAHEPGTSSKLFLLHSPFSGVRVGTEKPHLCSVREGDLDWIFDFQIKWASKDILLAFVASGESILSQLAETSGKRTLRAAKVLAVTHSGLDRAERLYAALTS